MKIPKPTDDDKRRFHDLAPDAAGVEVKPMFGNLGAFVNGNMFMGLFGADVGLRLAPDDATSLRAVEGAGPFGPAERPMGGWVTLPPSLAATDQGDVWIRRALDPPVPRVRQPIVTADGQRRRRRHVSADDKLAQRSLRRPRPDLDLVPPSHHRPPGRLGAGQVDEETVEVAGRGHR